MTDSTHPLAHLGPAPYTLLGFETAADRGAVEAAKKSAGGAYTTNLCGGTCDLCGTAIFNVAHIRCGNGARIKLGCDCVEKVFAPRGKIVTAAKRFVAQRRTAQRHATEACRISAAEVALAADAALLTDKPHPHAGRASNGDTLRSWADWMLANSGNAGKIKVAKALGL